MAAPPTTRMLLQDWVTDHAASRPDASAVVMNGERLTYAELEAASNRLARMLTAAGCRRGDRVGVLMPKSPGAIVGILGILKADCAYVPLDPASPVPRLARMVRSCEPRYVLTVGSLASVVDELFEDERIGPSLGVGWMEIPDGAATGRTSGFSLADCERWSDAPLDCQNSGADAAYVLFTSGSTGMPKGVVITHANVVHFVEWAVRYFGLGPSERLSGHPPLHFDLSVADIFEALAVGAELHLVPPELNLLPKALPEFIRRGELTQWFSVPSVLTYLTNFDMVRFGDFPTLKRMLWCGEVLPTPVLMYWMKRLPHVQFTNLYGPTETTIASSYYTIPECPDRETAAIPIGSPCDGEELLVLDSELRPVASGEAGDLYIAGVGLSPGYWNDPERTRAVFLPDSRSARPSDRIYRTGDRAKVGTDGLVYFLGRTDTQIKSRGYRIELGEIEAALHTLPGLHECAVVSLPTSGFDGAVICCAYAALPGADLTPLTVRTALSKLLPAYMLPSRWRVLDRLPKNSNGKIDRPRVKEGFERDAPGSG